MRTYLASILIPVGLALGTLVTAPSPAHACGGMFCDNGPQPMPVDQTGEVIVFAVTEDRVEAHIQIQYDPETAAERFAWIVPVQALPEITVGSQQLFLNALNGTVPSYGFQTFVEACDYGGDYGGGSYGYEGGGCGTESGGSSASGGVTSGGGTGDPGTTGDTTGNSTEVLAQDSVGAFDYVVLESQNVDDLMMWLSDNDYYQDPAAEPILEEYLNENSLFVAFRMTQGADIAEIHPIVISYAGDEPCVPIRLTRIAAQEDMDIRAFFLADDRFAPTNYRHVELNELKLDWFQFAPSYKEAVAVAVDSPMADGHAFVTEYAGASSAISINGLHSPGWEPENFIGLAAFQVVDRLAFQGLIQCAGDTCTPLHPLVMGLLSKYVPVPDGLEAGEFYSCLECFEEMIDQNAWDDAAFAAEMTERIVDPGLHAQSLIQTHDYVTRLYTTISPGEMTIDPTFHANPDLGTVDRRQLVAQVDQPCEGSASVSVQNFTPITLKQFMTWPDIAPEEMPWAVRIEEVPPTGMPQVLVDNADVISTFIDEWNGPDPALQPRSCHGDSDKGCACSADDTDSRSSLALGLALFASTLLVTSRRRRRRRSA